MNYDYLCKFTARVVASKTARVGAALVAVALVAMPIIWALYRCPWSGFGSYTNSKGELWENRVLDVLSHVLLHSAYHRGQIALEIRRSGSAPAYTDYIHAVRQGLLE